MFGWTPATKRSSDCVKWYQTSLYSISMETDGCLSHLKNKWNTRNKLQATSSLALLIETPNCFDFCLLSS